MTVEIGNIIGLLKSLQGELVDAPAEIWPATWKGTLKDIQMQAGGEKTERGFLIYEHNWWAISESVEHLIDQCYKLRDGE